ncbi:MAG: hypothetical protein O3B09_00435 [Proteobacteria bacterium]|nr:hypothetical protein [Pseudomonadota bacterium]
MRQNSGGVISQFLEAEVLLKLDEISQSASSQLDDARKKFKLPKRNTNKTAERSVSDAGRELRVAIEESNRTIKNISTQSSNIPETLKTIVRQQEKYLEELQRAKIEFLEKIELYSKALFNNTASNKAVYFQQLQHFSELAARNDAAIQFWQHQHDNTARLVGTYDAISGHRKTGNQQFASRIIEHIQGAFESFNKTENPTLSSLALLDSDLIRKQKALYDELHDTYRTDIDEAQKEYDISQLRESNARLQLEQQQRNKTSPLKKISLGISRWTSRLFRGRNIKDKYVDPQQKMAELQKEVESTKLARRNSETSLNDRRSFSDLVEKSRSSIVQERDHGTTIKTNSALHTISQTLREISESPEINAAIQLRNVENTITKIKADKFKESINQTLHNHIMLAHLVSKGLAKGTIKDNTESALSAAKKVNSAFSPPIVKEVFGIVLTAAKAKHKEDIKKRHANIAAIFDSIDRNQIAEFADYITQIYASSHNGESSLDHLTDKDIETFALHICNNILDNIAHGNVTSEHLKEEATRNQTLFHAIRATKSGEKKSISTGKFQTDGKAGKLNPHSLIHKPTIITPDGTMYQHPEGKNDKYGFIYYPEGLELPEIYATGQISKKDKSKTNKKQLATDTAKDEFDEKVGEKKEGFQESVGENLEEDSPSESVKPTFAQILAAVNKTAKETLNLGGRE